MTPNIIRGAVIAALLSAGLVLAPSAAAAPAPAQPVPPGPPPGYDGLPYHNMPGRIGHQPGAYTWILGFWMRPRRVLDTAGTSAMSNTDSDMASYGLPGSQLGVEPLRNSTLGVAAGVRPQTEMEDSIGSPNPSGGVVPGAMAPHGPDNTSKVPLGRAKWPVPDGESVQPEPNSTMEPDSLNASPDFGPTPQAH